VTQPIRPDIPRRVMDIPSAARVPAAPAKPAESEGKKLIVGRDISLSGNITACDKLVVEGTVEANLKDAGFIEIAETGLFKGSAEVDEAEIGGRFKGDLVVRKKLTIRATGKVEGTVRYARLVVECGGEISGTVEVMHDLDRAEDPRTAEEPRPAAVVAPAYRLAEPQ
jgi:cytoskeletal protein CcmA (bactofilin family)